MYSSEVSDCVWLNLLNASEVWDKQERFSRGLPLLSFACNSKVPEGFWIYELYIRSVLVSLVWEVMEGLMGRDYELFFC